MLDVVDLKGRYCTGSMLAAQQHLDMRFVIPEVPTRAAIWPRVTLGLAENSAVRGW